MFIGIGYAAHLLVLQSLTYFATLIYLTLVPSSASMYVRCGESREETKAAPLAMSIFLHSSIFGSLKIDFVGCFDTRIFAFSSFAAENIHSWNYGKLFI